MEDATGHQKFLNSFLGTTVGALMASVLHPVVAPISPSETPEASTNQVEAGLTTDPQVLGRGFKIVRFGAEPVILIKVAKDHYRAFASTCRHAPHSRLAAARTTPKAPSPE